MAVQQEAKQARIRAGLEPPPSSAQRHRSRSITLVKAEYIAWGEAQGGRNGRPWSVIHARNRRTQLEWWKKQLGLDVLADFDNVLPHVEHALRRLQDAGKVGKTLQNVAETLRAFCAWCVQRGYLANDPLKNLAPFDTTPRLLRRALTPDEVRKLLAVLPEHRLLLYATAVCTGLRLNELRSLRIGHFDRENCGLRLEASWTKNRKPGFQPLPAWLAEQLFAFIQSGEAYQLYRTGYRNARRGEPPEALKSALLYVPRHPERLIIEDLKIAGIERDGPAGRIDFHSLRCTYISQVVGVGASIKEVQALARHSTAALTLGVYAKTREERLARIADAVGNAFIPKNESGNTTEAERKAAGAESYCPASAYDQPVVGSNPTPATT